MADKTENLPQTVTGEIKFVSPEYAGQLIKEIDRLKEERRQTVSALLTLADEIKGMRDKMNNKSLWEPVFLKLENAIRTAAEEG